MGIRRNRAQERHNGSGSGCLRLFSAQLGLRSHQSMLSGVSTSDKEGRGKVETRLGGRYIIYITKPYQLNIWDPSVIFTVNKAVLGFDIQADVLPTVIINSFPLFRLSADDPAIQAPHSTMDGMHVAQYLASLGR